MQEYISVRAQFDTMKKSIGKGNEASGQDGKAQEIQVLTTKIDGLKKTQEIELRH